MSIIEEFVGLVGWQVDDSELLENEKNVEKTERTYLSFNKVLQATAAVLSGVLLVATNKSTTEMDQLAKSVFISTGTIGALAQAVEVAGFTFDNVIDLAEELNNKLGESKGIEEMTAVKEATDILGLSFEKLNKQSPEEQFLAVLNAAKMLEDQQLAVSAADILLGAEANRIIGVLRQEEGTIEDLVARFRELNFLTEEGRDGAGEFTKESNKLGNSLGSLSRQIAGLLGKAITPLIQGINEFIAANKEVVSQALLTFFENFNRILIVIAGSLGFLLALKIPVLFLAISSAMSSAVVAMSALVTAWLNGSLAVLALNASMLLIPVLIAAAAIAIGLLVEDIVTFFQGGDSAIGRFLERFPIVGAAARTLGAIFSNVFDGILFVIDRVTTAFMDVLTLRDLLVDSIASIDFEGLIPDFVKDLISNVTVTDFPTATQPVAETPRRFFQQETPVNLQGVEPQAPLATPAGNLSNTSNVATNFEQTNAVEININQQPGESGEDLAGRINDGLAREVANAVRELNNGVER